MHFNSAHIALFTKFLFTVSPAPSHAKAAADQHPQAMHNCVATWVRSACCACLEAVVGGTVEPAIRERNVLPSMNQAAVKKLAQRWRQAGTLLHL